MHQINRWWRRASPKIKGTLVGLIRLHTTPALNEFRRQREVVQVLSNAAADHFIRDTLFTGPRILDEVGSSCCIEDIQNLSSTVICFNRTAHHDKDKVTLVGLPRPMLNLIL